MFTFVVNICVCVSVYTHTHIYSYIFIVSYHILYSYAFYTCLPFFFQSVQFSYSVGMTLCNPYSTPGFPVYHQLPELAQTHVHWVGHAIQPSRPLSSPSLPAFSLSGWLKSSPRFFCKMSWRKHQQIFSQPQINTLFSLFKYPIHFNLSINKSHFPYVGEATV